MSHKKMCLGIAYSYLNTVGDTNNIEDIVRLCFSCMYFLQIF